MRLVLSLLIGLAAVACATEPPPPADPTTGARPPSRQGQPCAGPDNLRCEEGLQCVENGSMHADETGVCMK